MVAACVCGVVPRMQDSLVLALKDLREALGGASLSAEQVAAANLLGARCYVNWPYLQEARVVRISDKHSELRLGADGKPQTKRLNAQETSQWEGDSALHVNGTLVRTGVELGRVDILLGVKVCRGYVRHVDSTITKTYADEEQIFALQVSMRLRWLAHYSLQQRCCTCVWHCAALRCSQSCV